MASSHSQTNSVRVASRSRPLGKLFLITLCGMTVFEVVKSLVHPDITLWESHVVTIVFSAVAAVVGGTSALKKYEQLQQQLLEVITEQAQTEKRLRLAQGELEKHVHERTIELVKANAALKLEIAERRHAEEVERGQTAALTRTLHLLTSSSSVDAVLAHVLTAITEQLQAYSSVLYRFDLEHQHAWIERVYYDGKVWFSGQKGEVLPLPPEPIAIADEPVIQRLVRTRSPVIIEDVLHSSLLTTDSRNWAVQFGIQSVLFIPLLLEGNVLGSLIVRHREPRQYRTEEIALAVSLAHQAVLALRITQLAGQGQRTAVIAERNRMAREIHDTLSQGFTGIIVQLEAADDVLEETPEEIDSVREHIASARTLARESLAEARRSVFNLRPQVLEHGTLQAAIAHIVQTLTAGTALQTDFSVTGAPRPLPIEVEENLLRISQQALTNVLQHAQARAAQVQLVYSAEDVRLVIRDDGRGLHHTKTDGQGFGLTAMQQRAEQIAGCLTVLSHLGQGTTVTVTVPLSAQYPPGNSYDSNGENQPHSHSHRG